jgi:hypothetical protein
MFYERYLHEYNAWMQTRNTFVGSKVSMEGESETSVINETSIGKTRRMI